MAKNTPAKVLELGFALKRDNPEAFKAIEDDLNKLKAVLDNLAENKANLALKDLDAQLKTVFRNLVELNKKDASEITNTITKTIAAIEQEQAKKQKAADKEEDRLEKLDKKREESAKRDAERKQREIKAAEAKALREENIAAKQLFVLEDLQKRLEFLTKKETELREKANDTRLKSDIIAANKTLDARIKTANAIKSILDGEIKADQERTQKLADEATKQARVATENAEKLQKAREKSFDVDQSKFLKGIESFIGSFDNAIKSIASGQVPIDAFKESITQIANNFGITGQVIGAGITSFISFGQTLFELSERAGETQRRFDLLGKTTGLATDNIAAAEIAAKSIGASFVQVVSATDLLLERTESALKGTERFANTFRKLGIEQGRLNELSKDTNALFTEVLKRFSALPGGIEKATVGYELFGIRAQKVIDQLANINFDALVAKVKDSGIVLDDLGQNKLRALNDALLNFDVSFKGILNLIGAEGAPTFTELAKLAETVFEKLKADPAVKEGLEDILKVTLALVKAFGTEAIEDIGKFFEILGKAGNTLELFINFESVIKNLANAVKEGKFTALDILEVIASFLQVIPLLSQGITLIKGAIDALRNGSIKPLTEAIKEAGSEILNLITNPFGSAKDGLVNLGKAFGTLGEKINELKPDELANGFTIIDGAGKKLIETLGLSEAQVKALEEQFKSAKETSKLLAEEIELNAKKEIAAIEELKISDLEKAKLILETEQSAANEKIRIAEDNLKKLKELSQQIIVDEKEIKEQELALEKAKFEAKQKVKADEEKLRKKELEAIKQEAKELADFTVKQITDQIQKVSQLESSGDISRLVSLQQRKKLAEEKSTAEIKEIESVLKSDKLTEEEREKLQEKLKLVTEKNQREILDLVNQTNREIVREEKRAIDERASNLKASVKNIDDSIDNQKKAQKSLIDTITKDLKDARVSDGQIAQIQAQSNIEFIRNEIKLLDQKAAKLRESLSIKDNPENRRVLENTEKRISDLKSEQLDTQLKIAVAQNDESEFVKRTAQAVNNVNSALQEQENLLAKINDLAKANPLEATIEDIKDYKKNLFEIEDIIKNLERLANEGKIDLIGLRTLDFAREKYEQLFADIRIAQNKNFLETQRENRKIIVEEFEKAQQQIKRLQEDFDKEQAEISRRSRKRIKDLKKEDAKDTEDEIKERNDIIKAGDDELLAAKKAINDRIAEEEQRAKDRRIESEIEFQKFILDIERSASENKFKQIREDILQDIEFQKERKKAQEELDKVKKDPKSDQNDIAEAQKKLDEIDNKQKASNELRDKLKALEVEREKKRNEIIAEAQKKRANASSQEELDLIDKQTKEKLDLLNFEIDERKKQEIDFDKFKDTITAEQKKKLKEALDAEIAERKKTQEEKERLDQQALTQKLAIIEREKQKQKEADAQRLQDIIDGNKKELDAFDDRAKKRKDKVIAEIEDERRRRDKAIIDSQNKEIESINAVKEEYKALFTGIDAGVLKNINSFSALKDLLENIRLLALANADEFGNFANKFAEAILAALGKGSGSKSGGFNITSTNNNNAGIGGFNITTNNNSDTQTSDDKEDNTAQDNFDKTNASKTNKFKGIITKVFKPGKVRKPKIKIEDDEFEAVETDKASSKPERIDLPDFTPKPPTGTSGNSGGSGGSGAGKPSTDPGFVLNFNLNVTFKLENLKGNIGNVSDFANDLVKEFVRSINGGAGKKLIEFVETNLKPVIKRLIKENKEERDGQDKLEIFNGTLTPLSSNKFKIK